MKVLLYSVLLLLSACRTSNELTVSKNTADSLSLKGYTQFSIYTGRDVLGYIDTPGQEKTFVKKVWKGKISYAPVRQRIVISNSSENAGDLKMKLQGVFSSETSLDKIREINLVLDNPVEYFLEDIIPEKNALTDAESLKQRFVGAVLKAEKITLEFVTKDGITLRSEADIKSQNISLGTGIKSSTKENSLYVAENVYVGYKMFDPPVNISKLIADANLSSKQSRIAVLPFSAESTDVKDQKYTIGLQEATARALNQIEGIAVLDRNSYQQSLEEENLGKTNFDIRNALKVGKQMNANNILIGKFLHEADDVRITSEMISVDSGTVVPHSSIKYDTKAFGKGLIKIADEWEELILSKYGKKNTKKEDIPAKTPEEAPNTVLGTKIEEAYEFYRKGMEKFLISDETSLLEAAAFFREALRIDPGFARARARLSSAYQILVSSDFNDGKEEEYLTLGYNEALKAYQSAPNSSETNIAVGQFNLLFQKYLDLTKAVSHFEKAISLNPKDAEAHIFLWYAKVYTKERKVNLQDPLLIRSFELNPNLFINNYLVGNSLNKEKRYKESLPYLEKALKISPRNMNSMITLSSDYMNLNQMDKAKQMLESAEKIGPSNFYVCINYGAYYAKQKELDKALEYYGKASYIKTDNAFPLKAMAILYKNKGESAKAKEYFQKACELSDRESCTEAGKN
ncbi:MAG TPA: hypothetical protein PK453_15215 [Leptospiraceae bacterium]|nr:hypothetical protein [Leptospiraceae bacterium]HMY65130.1 hypothetical protein [Leptospiraceae bacterium]HNF15016.1 hypothetical protein [Leptospiraceae bacterium]HNF25864.1 hypothetical protein [Leptospiraceae bacterium]HNN06345.1 hypothetical protein [Leptospiraceae bacterium]